jgi:hypothetical protein
MGVGCRGRVNKLVLSIDAERQRHIEPWGCQRVPGARNVDWRKCTDRVAELERDVQLDLGSTHAFYHQQQTYAALEEGDIEHDPGQACE